MSIIESSRPLRVEVRETESGYSLFRDGEPYFVKGAGGFEHLELLSAFGGNSVRTWGIEQTEKALPEIRRTGLSLCAGIWLVPPRQGFDYADEEAWQAQFADLKEQVLALQSEPSLLAWGVGNELELGGGADESVWRAVEQVAAFIKEVDPMHPVMTVLASPDGDSLDLIDANCPSLDFVSINSYGELETVQPKLDALGWKRPYLVTEWGANGHWEVSRTSWGAEIEPTSTEKAAQIRRRYRKLDGSHGQCLGSYVFLWGSKQERTPTWYGLLSSEGRVTEAVEALEALWKGGEESGCCPRISAIRLNGVLAEGDFTVERGGSVSAEVDVYSGEANAMDFRWSIARESEDKRLGGDREAACEAVSVEISMPCAGKALFLAPFSAGEYRLYLDFFGPENTVATANFPFRVV